MRRGQRWQPCIAPTLKFADVGFETGMIGLQGRYSRGVVGKDQLLAGIRSTALSLLMFGE